jgi:hypothetical protein
MAQTRKKRRSKHRGTAAGTIEARGRTGRKPTDAERARRDGGSQRGHRLDRPPSWKSAATRAAFASLLLFVFTRLGIGPQIELAASVLLCLLALAIYIPLGFATDRWVYNRRQKRKAAAG